jgi:hypothetical protein
MRCQETEDPLRWLELVCCILFTPENKCSYSQRIQMSHEQNKGRGDLKYVYLRVVST